ncbi:unnamed protein product [Prorocentrum cordatum]|nr:unnamed protein product [Polarella glacialis]
MKTETDADEEERDFGEDDDADGSGPAGWLQKFQRRVQRSPWQRSLRSADCDAWRSTVDAMTGVEDENTEKGANLHVSAGTDEAAVTRGELRGLIGDIVRAAMQEQSRSSSAAAASSSAAAGKPDEKSKPDEKGEDPWQSSDPWTASGGESWQSRWWQADSRTSWEDRQPDQKDSWQKDSGWSHDAAWTRGTGSRPELAGWMLNLEQSMGQLGYIIMQGSNFQDGGAQPSTTTPPSNSGGHGEEYNATLASTTADPNNWWPLPPIPEIATDQEQEWELVSNQGELYWLGSGTRITAGSEPRVSVADRVQEIEAGGACAGEGLACGASPPLGGRLREQKRLGRRRSLGRPLGLSSCLGLAARAAAAAAGPGGLSCRGYRYGGIDWDDVRSKLEVYADKYLDRPQLLGDVFQLAADYSVSYHPGNECVLGDLSLRFFWLGLERQSLQLAVRQLSTGEPRSDMEQILQADVHVVLGPRARVVGGRGVRVAIVQHLGGGSGVASGRRSGCMRPCGETEIIR